MPPNIPIGRPPFRQVISAQRLLIDRINLTSNVVTVFSYVSLEPSACLIYLALSRRTLRFESAMAPSSVNLWARNADLPTAKLKTTARPSFPTPLRKMPCPSSPRLRCYAYNVAMANRKPHLSYKEFSDRQHLITCLLA